MGYYERKKQGKREPYSDFSNVEAQNNFLTAEEFPEGCYGVSFYPQETVSNKSTPWEQGQRKYSAFNYEFKNLHQDIPRKYPGAHLPHDDPRVNEQVPYGNPDDK